ncbi:hypothetical protein G6L86_15190 [Agrobacterium tumefaciens]|uniref:hypothetical protein n=1 Tax=Agrobacterium tumefaciens TaxID=358 RepID=UPI0015720B73|nr:hypothetical protein [Agrobacterium tumefaciens]NSX86941.1 hypothetical protein [Agrobacterium tumefaciens]
MPLLSNFVVKHIRPFGEAGYDAFGNAQTIEFLSSLGLSTGDIASIFAAWRLAALADPVGESNLLVAAANALAQARWENLYETQMSTVLFLDDVQLESLSHLEPGANSNFSWRSPTPIAAAVTIHNGSNRHHIIWEATGFSGGTDENGWISHFADLLPTER